jgi:predicted dehydrogenase
MRFALLGEGAKALAVAQAVIAHPEHRLVRQISIDSIARPHAPGATISGGAAVPFIPGIRITRNWEELLTDAEVDAVIVGGHDDELQAVVRQLVQAGKAVLVAPELVQSAAFFYELSLVESESPGRIFPMLALRGHPLVRKLHELILQGGLGNIRHVQFDRKIAAHAAHGRAATMSPPELANALLIDSDLLRSLCGSYDQVTASRSGDAGLGYSLATVMLAGSGVPQAVWTAKAHSENDWQLTISGDAGTALLDGNPEAGRLRLTRDLHEPPRGMHEMPADAEETSAHAGTWLLETFTSSLAPQTISTSPAEVLPDEPAQPTLWGELARAVELVDAVDRSVRRRRTIDVYFETPSERGIFKTQMTAVGCSLLMLTLAAVVFYLILAATVELPPLMKRLLVVAIFLPLGAFLALQLLVFVARPASRDVR